jgi:hypothetical protein
MYCGNRLSRLNKMLIFGVGVMISDAKARCLLSFCKGEQAGHSAVDFLWGPQEGASLLDMWVALLT